MLLLGVYFALLSLYDLIYVLADCHLFLRILIQMATWILIEFLLQYWHFDLTFKLIYPGIPQRSLGVVLGPSMWLNHLVFSLQLRRLQLTRRLVLTVIALNFSKSSLLLSIMRYQDPCTTNLSSLWHCSAGWCQESGHISSLSWCSNVCSWSKREDIQAKHGHCF